MRIEDLDYPELKKYYTSVLERIAKLEAHLSEVGMLIAKSEHPAAQVISPAEIPGDTKFGEM